MRKIQTNLALIKIGFEVVETLERDQMDNATADALTMLYRELAKKASRDDQE